MRRREPDASLQRFFCSAYSLRDAGSRVEPADALCRISRCSNICMTVDITAPRVTSCAPYDRICERASHLAPRRASSLLHILYRPLWRASCRASLSAALAPRLIFCRRACYNRICGRGIAPLPPGSCLLSGLALPGFGFCIVIVTLTLLTVSLLSTAFASGEAFFYALSGARA